jgi:hypothetical protein
MRTIPAVIFLFVTLSASGQDVLEAARKSLLPAISTAPKPI